MEEAQGLGQDSTVPESSVGSTFDAEIDQLFGGLGGSDSTESPDETTDDRGAPPVSSTASSSENAAGVQATTSPPGQEEKTTGAPPASPTTGANQAIAQHDPLKDTSPFSYTVNGQTRTFDGLTMLGDKTQPIGAFVTAEHIPKLQQRLSERDHYFEKDRENYQKFTALEQQSKALLDLTTWNAGKDAQGRDRILTGAEALAEQRAFTARTLATLQTIAAVFDDPQQFAQLVAVQQGPDGTAYITPDANAIRTLRVMAENAAIKADGTARSHFTSIGARSQAQGVSHPSSPSSPSPADLGTIDQTTAVQSVDQIIADMKLSGLTADDKTFLIGQLPRYIRAPTTEERAQFGPETTRIIDGSFQALIAREAARRSQVAATAISVTKAANDNAARLAAAAAGSAGRRPSGSPRTPPQATATRTDDSEAQWAHLEQLMNGRSVA